MNRLFFLSSAVATTFFATSGFAYAADAPADPTQVQANSPPPVTAASPAVATAASDPADADRRKAEEEERNFKPFAITLNPLSAAIGRFGANFEYLPAKHHALTINPFGNYTSADGDSKIKTTYSGFGAEAGYRFYTGSRGANGFFVGPAFVFMSNSSTTTGGAQEVSSSFTAYGGALDIGGQHVFDFGLTIGGGFGLMYLKSSAEGSAGATSSTVKFDGIFPRFLATAGWSF